MTRCTSTKIQGKDIITRELRKFAINDKCNLEKLDLMTFLYDNGGYQNDLFEYEALRDIHKYKGAIEPEKSNLYKKAFLAFNDDDGFLPGAEEFTLKYILHSVNLESEEIKILESIVDRLYEGQSFSQEMDHSSSDLESLLELSQGNPFALKAIRIILENPDASKNSLYDSFLTNYIAKNQARINSDFNKDNLIKIIKASKSKQTSRRTNVAKNLLKDLLFN